MANFEFHRYVADTELIFQGAEKALKDLGLEIESADLDFNQIQFRSTSRWKTLGGQKLTVSFLEEMSNTVEVRVSTRVNSFGQMLDVPDWTKGRTIAKSVLSRMADYFDSDSPTELLVPDKIRFRCRNCRGPLKPESQYCESCGTVVEDEESEKKSNEPKRPEESEDDFFDSLGMGNLKETEEPKPSKPKPKPTSQTIKETFVLCDCGTKLKVKTQTAGAKLRCPNCKLEIVFD